MVTHIYKKGETLFREGSYPTGIYFITKGKVKKYKTDKEGREQIFYVCKSGELLGYHALISEEHYTDSSSTLEESTISFIPKDDFLKTIQASPILSNRLLKCMSHEFGVLVNSITVFAQRTVRERLALSLLILRDKYKKEEQNGKPVELTLSRDDLAKMVGTARETLTRLLHDFKVENLIEIDGRKIILKKPLEISKIANLY
jgi:CRP-like cAMP-binding protein